MNDIPEGFELVSEVPDGYEIVGGASSPSSNTEPDKPINWKQEIARGVQQTPLVGQAEALATLLTSIPAGIYGPLVEMSAHKQGLSLNEQREAAGKAMENMTYQPRSEAGKNINEQLGTLMNQVGIPAAGVAHTMPPLRTGQRVPRAPKAEIEIPKGYEVVDIDLSPAAESKRLQKQLETATQSELPLENTAQQAAEMRAKAVGQRDLFENAPDLTTPKLVPEVAPEPFKPTATNQMEMPDAAMAVAPQYGIHEGLGRVDENGMPVRADISMEAQNLQDPLQRGLWGDELPGKTGDGGLPLTQAIDKMPETPWYGERDAAIAQLQHDLVASDPLLQAIEEARSTYDRPITSTFNKGMGKKQGGAINFKEIADAIKQLIDPSAIRNADKIPFQKTAVDVYNKIPGMAEGIKDYIPDNPVVADVKASVLKEGAENGGIALKGLRSGAMMVGEQRQSALIQATGRYVLNGVKRAERSVRQFVEPFEKSIGRMTANEVSQFAELLKKEMFDGVTGDLSALTTKTREAYQKLRSMQKEVLQHMNETRLSMGMEPVTPKEAYLSSRWQGSFRTPVYDKNGKLVWYIAETSKRKANNALKYLQSKGLEIDLTKSKVEYKNYNSLTRGSLEDAYQTMINTLDQSDPRFDSIKSIMEEAMANNAYDTLGQKKHFEPKGNVRGFVGDMPWRSDKAQAYGMLKQQVAYAKNGFQWAESQQAVSSIKELLADPEINTLQPNNVEYARQYVKNHLGYGESKIIRAIENELSKTLGIDKAGAYDLVGKAKGLFLTMKLTANLGYYASQAFQMLNSIPEHAYLDSNGFKHNPFQTAARANRDFAAGITHNTADLLGGKTPKLDMSPLGKDAWAYMEENGISNRSILDEAAGLGENKFGGALKAVADYPIAKSEQIIRSNTFLQFAHHLDQSGKFTNMKELFQKAEEATNRSMVDFRREERALVFSQMGLVGRGAETLKSYLVNYYNNLGRYSQEALKGKPKALAYFLGIQASLYGVLNLPGAQEVNDSWDLIKKHAPDSIYESIRDIDPRKYLIKHMDDWAYGGVSKVTGLNLSNRGNIAIDNSFALDGMFPFITDQWKQAKALGSLAMDPMNATKQAQVKYQSAPSGPIQGSVSVSEPFQAGVNSKGETIFQKPSKLMEHEHDYDRTQKQITNKKYGFTDLAEAKNKDLTFLQNQDERNMADRRKASLTKMFDAMVRKDKADVDLYRKRYLNFNGDPEQLVNGLFSEAMKMRVSPERLQAIEASNVPSLKKLQALQQLIGEVR